MDKSVAWKILYGSPRDRAKGDRNKGGGYISAYALGKDRNKTSERQA